MSRKGKFSQVRLKGRKLNTNGSVKVSKLNSSQRKYYLKVQAEQRHRQSEEDRPARVQRLVNGVWVEINR
jgi:hypothetical protein|tara:strand:+ start:112 stop:321 length:210 start_codon:yes stop_codon:yes gene_type:complete